MSARVDRAKLPQAERAVRNFMKLRPTLDSFARALSGRDVSVQIGENTLTDGKRIFLMPPYALGDDAEHERTMCDKRDEDGTPMCPACMVRETVLVHIYHEISHLTYGSFDHVSMPAFAWALKGIKLTETQWDRISTTIAKQAAKLHDPHVTQVASRINRYLPHLINALEDVRVNARMADARRGTALMVRADRSRVLREGYKRMDGNTVRWQDLDLNAQLTIGMMCKAEGFDATSVLNEYVLAVLDDEQISNTLVRVSSAASMLDSATLSVEALVRAQSFGFYLSDNPEENYAEEPEAPEEESNDEEEEGATGDAGADSEGEGVREPEGSGEDDRTDEPGERDDSLEEGGSSGSDAEESGRDGDSDGDGGLDDLDSSSPEDDGEGADTPGSDGEDSEPDGEGGGAPGTNGSDEGDTDPSGASMGGAGETGGEPAPGEYDSDGDGEAVREGSDNAGAGSGPAVDSLERAEPSSDSGREEGRLTPPPDADFGDHHETEKALEAFIGHDESLADTRDDKNAYQADAERRAVESAHAYVEHFDEISDGLHGVKIMDDIKQFPRQGRSKYDVKRFVGESVLGPSTLHMRRAFTDNMRGAIARNKRSGRVNARVLGRRAWSDDDRLFIKKSMPGKKDYAVLIGVDMSGSTSGDTYLLEINAAYAQAELCQRMGIKFAVYAHSGTAGHMNIYTVKTFGDPWNSEAINKLNSLGPVHMNLDGHTMEFYRKRLDEVNATHKILMYYSDGAMPAENYREELAVLKREIRTCKRKGYVLMAVGARTDAPIRHGLDTVRIDDVQDVPLVVKHLGKRIADL